VADPAQTKATAAGDAATSLATWKLALLLVLAGGLAAGFGWWVGTAFNRPAPVPVPAHVTVAEVGAALPDLALAGLDGKAHSLADFRGRPLVINFWATWCPPCIAEMPMLSAFDAEQAANGPRVIGIALDAPERVRAFLSTTPVGYPILLDRPDDDDASVVLGNTRGVLPYTVLINADGRILATHIGEFSRGSLERWLRRHNVDFVAEE
jgi:thiol-disulfide isomerase/thioredoxin